MRAKRLFSIIFILAAFLFSSMAQAQTTFQVCQSPRIAVAFSNGISTLSEYAEKELKLINRRTSQFPVALAKSTEASYLFYHEDNGSTDFAEVFIQKVTERQFDNITFSEKSSLFFNALAGVALTGPLAPVVRDLFSQKALPGVFDKVAARVATETQLDFDKSKEILASGDSLLIVAHSQGNLYANEVANKLYKELPIADLDARFSIVGAGVPSSKMIGKAGARTELNYVTNSYDVVISSLRLASIAANLLTPLPSNVNSQILDKTGPDKISTEMLQHSFIDVYFNESLDSGKKVVQLISDNLTALAATKNSVNSPSYLAYNFTTTLTFPMPIADLFAGASSIDVPQAGPYASSFKSKVVAVSANSLNFTTDVTCGLLAQATTTDAPLGLGLLLPDAFGRPAVTKAVFSLPGQQTSQEYLPSAVLVAPVTIQGSSGFTVSAITALARKDSGSSTVTLTVPPGSIPPKPATPA